MEALGSTEPWDWDTFELTEASRRRIARAVEHGVSTTTLAGLYGVTDRTIRRIAARERRKVVE